MPLEIPLPSALSAFPLSKVPIPSSHLLHAHEMSKKKTFLSFEGWGRMMKLSPPEPPCQLGCAFSEHSCLRSCQCPLAYFPEQQGSVPCRLDPEFVWDGR